MRIFVAIPLLLLTLLLAWAGPAAAVGSSSGPTLGPTVRPEGKRERNIQTRREFSNSLDDIFQMRRECLVTKQSLLSPCFTFIIHKYCQQREGNKFKISLKMLFLTSIPSFSVGPLPGDPPARLPIGLLLLLLLRPGVALRRGDRGRGRGQVRRPGRGLLHGGRWAMLYTTVFVSTTEKRFFSPASVGELEGVGGARNSHTWAWGGEGYRYPPPEG